MSRRKILVIDDEVDVRDMLRTVLSKSGYDVFTAANGTDGLIQANVEQPDLILLDIMMEKMDGWETLRLLKLEERSEHVPVVILSARVEPKDKIRALQEGAVDYFTKPFDLRDSLEKIELILADAEAEAAAEDTAFGRAGGGGAAG